MGAEGSSLAGAEAALVDGEHSRGRGKVAQRREHSVEFSAAIKNFNAEHHANIAGGNGGTLRTAGGSSRIQVAVRKRPLFDHEAAKGDFDSVACGADGVWMHRTTMRADLKHMVMDSFDFAFDGVFGDADDTDAVFEVAVAPLVASTLASGGVSTIMCFGQTGSGKTYTTRGIAERCATALFASLPAGATVSVVCVEVAGSKVHDLQNDLCPVKALEDAEGRVHLKARQVSTADAESLSAAIKRAQAGRATNATGVHDASSRSHSVCRVILHGTGGDEFGRIDLVDLAGSEWAADREQHSAERQREGSEINSSLMCLKACMRVAAVAEGGAATRLPYRQNELTKLLKESFVCEGARTLLLATLSPSSADVEHTLATLQHVAAVANITDEAQAQSQIAAAEAGVLQTEATKVARQILTTNVMMAQEMMRLAEKAAAGGTGGAADASSPEPAPMSEEGWQEKNPIDWNPGDTAVWWTAAASRAVEQINQAVAVAVASASASEDAPEAAPPRPPKPSADETVQLILEEVRTALPVAVPVPVAAQSCMLCVRHVHAVRWRWVSCCICCMYRMVGRRDRAAGAGLYQAADRARAHCRGGGGLPAGCERCGIARPRERMDGSVSPCNTTPSCMVSDGRESSFMVQRSLCHAESCSVCAACTCIRHTYRSMLADMMCAGLHL